MNAHKKQDCILLIHMILQVDKEKLLYNYSSIPNIKKNHWTIQHYVIKFVSDLRQVSGFLQVLQFPPPIKLTAII